MKFLADINIPQSVIRYLISEKHNVLDLKQINIKLSDLEIIKMAQKEKMIILTLDKDFVGLTQFPKYQVATIVIRLRNQNPGQILEHLKELLKNQEKGILENSFTMIHEGKAQSHPYS